MQVLHLLVFALVLSQAMPGEPPRTSCFRVRVLVPFLGPPGLPGPARQAPAGTAGTRTLLRWVPGLHLQVRPRGPENSGREEWGELWPALWSGLTTLSRPPSPLSKPPPPGCRGVRAAGSSQSLVRLVPQVSCLVTGCAIRAGGAPEAGLREEAQLFTFVWGFRSFEGSFSGVGSSYTQDDGI